MIEPSPENARKYGLTLRQLEVVSLVERRFNRASIAAYLGISLQSTRDIIGGLCDFYGCPTQDLPARVLASGESENSEVT